MDGYQLLTDDPDKFIVQHPDGSEIHIAKGPLDDSQKERIGALPKIATDFVDPNKDLYQMSSSEPLTSGSAATESFPPIVQNSPNVEPLNSDQAVVDASRSPASGATGGWGAETPVASTQASPVAPVGQDPMSQYNKIFNAQELANTQMGQSQAAGQKAMADVYGNFAKSMPSLEQQQAQMQAIQTQKQAILSQNKELQDKVMSGEIDPNRAWNNRSTGSKIMASIAMVLGGIGSGLTKGPNYAANIIQKQVDDDIAAQKANLGKQENMLSMNMRQYGDLTQAEAATRIQMGSLVQAQVAQQAAKTGSQTALNAAKIMNTEIEARKLPLQMQLAQMQVNNMSLNGQLKTGQVPGYLKQNPDYQAKEVVVGNTAYQAKTPDDAKKIKDLQAGYEPVMNMVRELNSMGASATVPNSEENLRANAIRARLVPMLNKMHGLNRLSEEDVKLMHDQVSDPTKFGQLLNGKAINTEFFKNLSDDLNSEYNTRLNGYKPITSFKPTR